MKEGVTATWGAVKPDLVILVRWEVDYSVFNGSTGETHVLSELPAEVVRRLSQDTMTQAALTSTLAELCEVEESPDWHEKISGILSDLADLELIEQTAS